MSQPGATVVAADRNGLLEVATMASALQADRAQVMAYRVAALGLAERGKDRPGDLAALDLGAQEYTPDSTQVALAARTSAELTDDRLIMVWAARGAPHLHRRKELRSLMNALWPVSDADASARINSAQIPEGVKLGIAAFRSEEHTSELQSRPHLVCRLLLETKNRPLHTCVSLNTNKQIVTVD